MTASTEPIRKKPKEAQQEEVSRTSDTHLHPTAARYCCCWRSLGLETLTEKHVKVQQLEAARWSCSSEVSCTN